MYEKYYKMKKIPFSPFFDPDFHFMSKDHKKVYDHLKASITETRECIAITGECGSGKTSVIDMVKKDLPKNISPVFIKDLSHPVESITEKICRAFKLDVTGKSKMGMLDFFHGFLLQQYEVEQPVILCFDDAQNLSLRALEELDVISNLEPEEPHLIQILLVGRPELNYFLGCRNIQFLDTRMQPRCHLKNMGLEDTMEYIHFRLEKAGAENTDIFDEDAICAIHEYSRGIPRVINVLCESAMAGGAKEEVEKINRAMIEGLVVENKKAGLFDNLLLSRETDVESDTDTITVAKPGVKSSSTIEQGMNQLLGASETIDRKLDMLIKKKDTKDMTIVELNKMLVESLKRHGNTLKQFRSFKEKAVQKKVPSRTKVVSHDGVI